MRRRAPSSSTSGLAATRRSMPSSTSITCATSAATSPADSPACRQATSVEVSPEAATRDRWFTGVYGSGYEERVSALACRLAGLGRILGKKNMMSGPDDLLAASNDRWSRAMRNAKDVEDIGLGQAVRDYYTRGFPAGVLAAIAVGVVAAMLGIADALALSSWWPFFKTTWCARSS